MRRYGTCRRFVLLLLACVAGCAVQEARSQESSPFVEIPLDDLGSFRPAASNWQIAGEVIADTTVDQHIRTSPGTGILVNRPTPDAHDNLFTTLRHGDVDLELDFLMPAGSNSGVYLQSRYEIQLFDSWGVDEPQFSDAGGIYQRWDESRPEGRYGYEGHAPRINASRPPGEWQHLRIVFEAPRFDEAGEKIRNARFVRVEHNGVVIHEEVEVTGPTRAAAFTDEQPLAPLMLQGDHGPVAFKNLRYRIDSE